MGSGRAARISPNPLNVNKEPAKMVHDDRRSSAAAAALLDMWVRRSNRMLVLDVLLSRRAMAHSCGKRGWVA